MKDNKPQDSIKDHSGEKDQDVNHLDHELKDVIENHKSLVEGMSKIYASIHPTKPNNPTT